MPETKFYIDTDGEAVPSPWLGRQKSYLEIIGTLESIALTLNFRMSHDQNARNQKLRMQKELLSSTVLFSANTAPALKAKAKVKEFPLLPPQGRALCSFLFLIGVLAQT